jgi:hypothetical protein
MSFNAVISVRNGAICTVLIVNTLSGWVNPEDEANEDEDEDEDEALI